MQTVLFCLDAFRYVFKLRFPKFLPVVWQFVLCVSGVCFFVFDLVELSSAMRERERERGGGGEREREREREL